MLFKKSYPQQSDEELMAAIIKGKECAFSELYRRYANKMFRYFYRMLWQNETLANDFTQDLFLKIAEKPERFDVNRKFSTWFFTVAGNMIKNEYRRRGNYSFTNEIPEFQPDTDHVYLPNELDRALFKTELAQAIDDLNPMHKTCFILRYQEEKSIKEISEIMDIPEGTVKSRIYYGLKKLGVKLKKFNVH